MTLLAAELGGRLALAQPPCDDTPNPCFTGVSDILNGQWQLLEDDDLIVSYVSNYPRMSALLTNDLNIGNQIGAGTTAATPVLPQVAVGRIWNLNPPYDTAIQFTPVAANQIWATIAYNAASSSFPSWSSPVVQTLTVTNPAPLYRVNAASAADFNQDGFDEIVLVYSFGSADAAKYYAQIYTAANLTDPIPVLAAAGSPVNLGNDLAVGAGYVAMTVGNFDGQPGLELAFAQNSNNQLAITFATVSPSTLQIAIGPPTQLAAELNLPPDSPRPMALTAGNFIPNQAGDELIVAYAYGGDKLWVQLLDVSGSLSPSIVTGDLVLEEPVMVAVQVKSGPLDSAAGNDQAVIGATNIFDGNAVLFVTVNTSDGNTSMTNAAQINFLTASIGCVFDLAVGRFDPPLLQTSSGPTTDFNYQVAVLGTQKSCSGPKTPRVAIYQTVANNGSLGLQLASSTQVSGASPNFGLGFLPMTLTQADIQGRSLRLGPPSIVTINQHTPSPTSSSGPRRCTSTGSTRSLRSPIPTCFRVATTRRTPAPLTSAFSPPPTPRTSRSAASTISLPAARPLPASRPPQAIPLRLPRPGRNRSALAIQTWTASASNSRNRPVVPTRKPCRPPSTTTKVKPTPSPSPAGTRINCSPPPTG